MELQRALMAVTAAACAAMIAAPAALAASEQDGVCADSPVSYDPAAERALRSLTNCFRHEYGKAPLRARGQLTRAARAHSLRMAQQGVFAHSNGGGGFPWAEGRPAGENLALAATPEQAIALLKESPSHRRTLLGATYRRIGIGALRTCTGHLLITQDFQG